MKEARPRTDQDASTPETTVTGTPAYMAPEVVLTGEITPQTDIYAVGCVAFEALTGEPVFEAKSAMDVIAAHVKDAPRRPSEVASGPIAPELEALVMRCLDKDPERRPKSCDDIMTALCATDLEAEWSSAEARSWWQRHAAAAPP